jgi:hypothetical protein
MAKHGDVLAPAEDEVVELDDPAGEEGTIICLESDCAEVECHSESPSSTPTSAPTA